MRLFSDSNKKMRDKILLAAYKSGEGHIPSALSILDILSVIYLDFPKHTRMSIQEDYEFVLSKGHASLALYAVLEEARFIDDSWVENFCSELGDFGGHPDRLKVAGVLSSSGSLGHGLPFSVGRVLGYRTKLQRKPVFCLIGDGELNEGSNWESFIIMEQFNLDEITVLVDLNGSTNRAITVSNLQDKFSSFGFKVLEIDGHHRGEILAALLEPAIQPKVVLAHTVKGKGISIMENNHAWHHKSPSASELEEFREIG